MNIFIGKFRMTSLRLPYSPPSAVSFLLHRRLFTTFQCSASRQSKKEKVIVISGPTGAGKSRLALELSKKLNGEIISADSVQVYQGLDVGSAKPSTSERQEVPHHLVDILHPSEDYSAGNFYDDGRQATKDILNRGRVPIVTGGTGLYLRWFIYGKPDVPKATSEISLEVQSELADFERTYDWDAAVQLVTNAGDPTAQSLPANDWYRLRRKLEIIKSSGLPPSAFPVPYDSFKGETASHSTDLGIDISTNGILDEKHKDLDYDFICFFLSTSRLDLYRSIDFRCEDMISGDTGILSEARWLLDMGLQPNSNSATRAIGYRQAMEYLLNCENQGGRSSTRDFYAFLSEFQKASRNFAKRQLTWFRNKPIYHWIDASRPLTEVLDFIYNAYHDQTGKLVVPRSLAMDKEMADRREITQLKTYRTKRGVLIDSTQNGHFRNCLIRHLDLPTSSSSSSEPSIKQVLRERIQQQIQEDQTCQEMLEANISRVTENMKRRQEILNLLSQMQVSSLKEIAVMFMVDLGERDEKQLKELADAITVLRCSMKMKMEFLSSF